VLGWGRPPRQRAFDAWLSHQAALEVVCVAYLRRHTPYLSKVKGQSLATTCARMHACMHAHMHDPLPPPQPHGSIELIMAKAHTSAALGGPESTRSLSRLGNNQRSPSSSSKPTSPSGVPPHVRACVCVCVCIVVCMCAVCILVNAKAGQQPAEPQLQLQAHLAFGDAPTRASMCVCVCIVECMCAVCILVNAKAGQQPAEPQLQLQAHLTFGGAPTRACVRACVPACECLCLCARVHACGCQRGWRLGTPFGMYGGAGAGGACGGAMCSC